MNFAKMVNKPYLDDVDTIFLDLDNARPATDEEKQIYDELSATLNKAPTILAKLHSYSGCEDSIRKAITSPGPETEEAAWNTVVPAVELFKEFYDFSLELESCFPRLLITLCKTDPKQNIASKQALAKLMADVFDFVLRFDNLKMLNPSIQNDFSYYRRTLNRKKITKTDVNITIRDEMANRFSLFFAYPTPMMNVLNETTTKFLGQNSYCVPRENIMLALATMANVCCDMISQRKFQHEETNMLCLRAMTGSVILFDHVHATGAFSRKSPIHIKQCINTLKNYPGPYCSTAEGLLNALRFSTIHLNDADTPPAVKQLLE